MKYDPQVTWVYVVNWVDDDFNGWDEDDYRTSILASGGVFSTLGGAQQAVLDDVNTDLKDINEAPLSSLKWTEMMGSMLFDDEVIVPVGSWETAVEELGVEIRIEQKPLLP